MLSLLINYLREPNINEDIYSLTLRDISGQVLNMSEYRNKPLIVHFWATWCPVCKLEAPNIEKVSTRYNVISIAVKSDSNEKIHSYMSENALNYTVVNDADGSLAKKFGIEVYPTTLIYDKKAQLQFMEVGYSTTLGLQIRAKLSN